MTKTQTKERLRVLHVISGDLWAGAEAQAYTLLKHLKPLCDVHAVLMNDGELARRLRDCNIPVTILDESKLSSWKIFLELRKHLKDKKPNVIHTHRQKENILGAFANSSTIKARCLRTAHGASEVLVSFKTKIIQSIDYWVGNYLQEAVIAVSDEVKVKLSSYIHIDKIKVINNGVDIDLLQSQVETADFRLKEPFKKHIGIVGRLAPVKRVNFFLEMAAYFKRENLTQYRFHVIGDGPMRDSLEEQQEALGLEDWVTFHGHCVNTPCLIKSLDVVVMCSDHEGLPLTALESIALGTPVASHLSGALGQLIEEHCNINCSNQSVEDYFYTIKNLKCKTSLLPKYFATKNARKTYSEYATTKGQFNQ